MEHTTIQEGLVKQEILKGDIGHCKAWPKEA